jgi:hypothetical protein
MRPRKWSKSRKNAKMGVLTPHISVPRNISRNFFKDDPAPWLALRKKQKARYATSAILPVDCDENWDVETLRPCRPETEAATTGRFERYMEARYTRFFVKSGRCASNGLGDTRL